MRSRTARRADEEEVDSAQALFTGLSKLGHYPPAWNEQRDSARADLAFNTPIRVWLNIFLSGHARGWVGHSSASCRVRCGAWFDDFMLCDLVPQESLQSGDIRWFDERRRWYPMKRRRPVEEHESIPEVDGLRERRPA